MNENGFGLRRTIILIVGIIVLIQIIALGIFYIRFQRDVKVSEEKEKAYQIYKESQK